MPGQEPQANAKKHDTTTETTRRAEPRERSSSSTRAPGDVHEAPESGTLREPPRTNAKAPASKPPDDVHEAPESGTIRDGEASSASAGTRNPST